MEKANSHCLRKSRCKKMREDEIHKEKIRLNKSNRNLSKNLCCVISCCFGFYYFQECYSREENNLKLRTAFSGCFSNAILRFLVVPKFAISNQIASRRL